jgi:hypothetical protein
LPAGALGDSALGGVTQQCRIGIVDMQKYLSAAVINSSSRHTVPSKKINGAPASRDLRSSVTSAQAARK